MKIWQVDTRAYGSFGFVVVAETRERAIELAVEKNPEYKGKAYALEVSQDSTKEWISAEFLW